MQDCKYKKRQNKQGFQMYALHILYIIIKPSYYAYSHLVT